MGARYGGANLMNLDKLAGAAEKDQRLGYIRSRAKTTTVLALADRLKAAEELIPDLVEALQHYERMGSEEYEAECIGGLISHQTDAALAKHTAYRERFPADE